MENNHNLRSVNVHIASLWRGGHIVKTIESVLANPETLTITAVLNNYSQGQYEYVLAEVNKLNAEYQVPIRMFRGNNAKESNEKLRYLNQSLGTYIALVDDDLILSPNHFQYLILGCERYNAHTSLHGVVLGHIPISSYYRDRMVLRGLGSVEFDAEVDMASNCGSLFKREWFSADEYVDLYERCPVQGMDDIILALALKKKGIKRVVLKHQQGFLQHKEIKRSDNYVFDKYALVQGADKVQTDYINQNWK